MLAKLLLYTGIPCTRSVSHTGYLTHGNSKGDAREGTDRRIMQESSRKSGRKERGHEEEKSQTRPD